MDVTFPEADRRAAVRLAMELMAIPGLSGQEGPVADGIIARLRKAGLGAGAIQRDSAHRKSPIGGDAGNLIVKLPGTVRRPRRLFSAHMDTVSICAGSRPVLRNGRIVPAARRTGVGGDDRAGCAAILSAALTILRRRLPHPPLTFLWTVQEEAGLHGSRFVAVSKLGRPAMGFNYDGSDSLTVGATGAYRMAITIEGIASHAGVRPAAGVSAITIASLATADLHRNGWLGAVRKGRKSGTGNVGVIRAGEATNVVTPRAEVRAEVRSHDPAFRKRMLRGYRDAFRRAARAVRSTSGRCGKVSFEHRLDYESFRLPASEPAVVAALEAVRAAGAPDERKISNGGLDANWLCLHGIPTVTLGAGNRNPHTVDEFVDVEAFLQGCEVALRLATDVR